MNGLILHRREAGVLHLSLNNVERHNALTDDIMNELTAIFRSIENEKDIRVVTLRGEGKSFCTGIDLHEINGDKPATKQQHKQAVKRFSDLLQAIVKCPLPVIAIGHGNVFGAGIGLLAAADISVAFESTSFCFSEVTLGLIPGIVSPYVIARIGIAHARRLFLTGEVFQWWDAKEMNLVNYVGTKMACYEYLNATIHQLQRGAPVAQADTKGIMNIFAGFSKPKGNLVNTLVDLTAGHRQSAEAKAGIEAFLTKKEPPWRM